MAVPSRKSRTVVRPLLGLVQFLFGLDLGDRDRIRVAFQRHECRAQVNLDHIPALVLGPEHRLIDLKFTLHRYTLLLV